MIHFGARAACGFGDVSFDEYVASGEAVALIQQRLGPASGIVCPGELMVVLDIVQGVGGLLVVVVSGVDVDGIGVVGCACGVDSGAEGDGEDVSFVVVDVFPDEVDSARAYGAPRGFEG